MKRKLTAAAAAAAVAISGVAAAAPASAAPTSVVAGNGTNNYYLTGSCKTSGIGGLYLNATNWDEGPNQRYHLNVTRSGVGYSVTGVYIDNVYLGKDLGEYLPWSGGHVRRTLKVTGKLVGFSTTYSCQFSL